MTYVYIKNKIINTKPKIDLFNASTFYGVNVFELILIKYNKTQRNYKIFRLIDHLDRLYKSAKYLNLNIQFRKSFFTKTLNKLIKLNDLKYTHTFKITVHLIGKGSWSQKGKDTFVTIAPSKKIVTNKRKKMKLLLSNIEKLPNNQFPSFCKCGASYIYGRYAQINNKDNELSFFLDRKKRLTETTCSNIFIIKNNKFFTPKLNSSILHGITRNTVIKLLKKNKFDILEKDLFLNDLIKADEVFLTGTSSSITSVSSFGKNKYQDVLTREINYLYNKLISE